MTRERMEAACGPGVAAFDGFEPTDTEGLSGIDGLTAYRGKVRDVFSAGDRVVIVASDRISAFDRVLSTVPWKGEILNRISAYWFENTKDIVPNHVLGPGELGGIDAVRESGRCMAARRADMLPVEVVVRGYLTGSAWRDYAAGKPVSGIELPGGLGFNERFPVPLLTPSTKEASGHDIPVSGKELVRSGRIEEGLWKAVETAALALFARGQELASRRGLVLVDTKYEFGVSGGKLVVADEIHTPDSSRYWYADTYESLFASGDRQRELDKEWFRQWLIAKGFMGDGEAPAIPAEVRLETAMRYVAAFETITGESFEPVCADAQAARAKAAYIVRETLSRR